MATTTVAGCVLEILDCGDSAVRVGVTASSPGDAWRVAHGIAALLDADAPAGVLGTLPTYDAVLVEFDCLLTDHETTRRAVRGVLDRVDALTPRRPRTFGIPVLYGGELGPDLDATASYLGLTPADVIAIHGAKPLLMRCFGAPAGAPMLDGPHFERPIPRLASPRPHVPAGAAAVAGRQAVVSARPAPGGWHVLGTTPVTLVDPSREPLSAYWPGDSFQFFAIEESQFDAHRGVLA